MNAPNKSFAANNPPFPQNPVIGQTWRNWTWNGCMWTTAPATGIRVLTQTFGASAPYMPSAGLISGVAECFGGGGAGGGAANPQDVLQYVLCGGGGGSGGYSRLTFQAAQVLGGVVVSVGAGGVGVANGVGGAGGVTSFGALCVANGGLGGNHCDANTGAGGGGAGAPAGIGDIAFPGASGQSGVFQDLASGAWYSANDAPGGWIFGGTQTGLHASGTGTAGLPGVDHSGAGGSGAVINQAASSIGSFPGGAGALGFCVVTEFCWNDGVAADCDCAPPGRARVTDCGPDPYDLPGG
jgi:hypothetical protein